MRDKSAFKDMTLVLLSDRMAEWLDRLANEGFLRKSFPEIQRIYEFRTKKSSKNLWKHTLKVIEQTPADPVLRWAALYHDCGKPDVVREGKKVTFHGHEARGAKIWEVAAKELKVGFPFYAQVGVVIRSSGDFAAITDNSRVSVTDGAVRRFIRGVGEEHLDHIYQFAMADMTTADKAKEQRMKKALTGLRKRMDKLIHEDENPVPRLPKFTGNKIMEATGLKGRALGDMMEYLTKGLVEGKLSVGDDFAQIAKDILEDVEREEYARTSPMAGFDSGEED